MPYRHNIARFRGTDPFDVNLFQIKQKPDETIVNYLARVYHITN